MLPNSVMIGRLLVAAVLGGMVGFERERLLWAAGLRTHMLVCIGSCLIIIVSAYGFNDVLGEKNVVLDPSRIAAQVVSGVGFPRRRNDPVQGRSREGPDHGREPLGGRRDRPRGRQRPLCGGDGRHGHRILAVLAGIKPHRGTLPASSADTALWPCWPHGVSSPSTS